MYPTLFPNTLRPPPKETREQCYKRLPLRARFPLRRNIFPCSEDNRDDSGTCWAVQVWARETQQRMAIRAFRGTPIDTTKKKSDFHPSHAPRLPASTNSHTAGLGQSQKLQTPNTLLPNPVVYTLARPSKAPAELQVNRTPFRALPAHKQPSTPHRPLLRIYQNAVLQKKLRGHDDNINYPIQLYMFYSCTCLVFVHCHPSTSTKQVCRFARKHDGFSPTMKARWVYNVS